MPRKYRPYLAFPYHSDPVLCMRAGLPGKIALRDKYARWFAISIVFGLDLHQGCRYEFMESFKQLLYCEGC